jgi:hypothetical protein
VVMTEAGGYRDEYPLSGPHRGRGLWNLLFFVPAISLYPPLYNRIEPRLLGMPFFYWFLMCCILLSSVCTFLVYWLTKDSVTTDRPDRLSVDALDEGARR